MPTHIGRSGSPSSSYQHLSPPSTPQHRQAPRSPRGHYQAKEELVLLPSASQIIFTQDVPTPEQAASRLAEDESTSIGPPFFVVFSGQEPGVFTSWYVYILLDLLIGFSPRLRPFVMRTCKWQKGDWKRYETKSAALRAYEDAYTHGGLRFKK